MAIMGKMFRKHFGFNKEFLTIILHKTIVYNSSYIEGIQLIVLGI